MAYETTATGSPPTHNSVPNKPSARSRATQTPPGSAGSRHLPAKPRHRRVGKWYCLLFFSPHRQQVNIAHFALAVFHAVQHFFHPARAFAAGRALSAGFVGVETAEIPGIAHDALVFVVHDEAAGTEHGTCCKTAVGETFIGHQAVFAVGGFANEEVWQNGHRRTARHTGFEFFAAFDAAAPLVGVEKFLHGDAHSIS
jgi:hypothetical protein